MRQITKTEFLSGYEQGYITDIIIVGNTLYGKDPRGMANTGKTYDIVWATIT